MKLTKRDLRLLENLTNLGVEFEVFGTHTSGGMHILLIEELIEYIKDPELWGDRTGAKQEGVSLEQYRAWAKFLSDRQCRGISAKGKRCKIIISHIPNAAEFNEDIDCYCNHHSRLG